MKTSKITPFLVVLLPFFLLFANVAIAQEKPGGARMHNRNISDSLHSGSQKSADGRYYYDHMVSVYPRSRMYIHFSAYGPQFKDLCLEFHDENGKRSSYLSNLQLDRRSGVIDLDTIFSRAKDFTIRFTTEKPNEKIRFSVMISYATEEAMVCPPQENICWKIAYLLKHSDNGFHFIISESIDFYSYETTVPILPDFPKESKIVKQMGSLFYSSTLTRGSRVEVENYYNKISAGLQLCMGSQFTYTTTTDENNQQHLTCIASAPTKDENIRNLKYMGNNLKPEMPKYQVSLYVAEKTSGDQVYYELILDVSNLFYQF